MLSQGRTHVPEPIFVLVIFRSLIRIEYEYEY